MFKDREFISIIIDTIYHFYLNSAFGRKKTNQIVLILFINSCRSFQKQFLPSSTFYFTKIYREPSVSLALSSQSGLLGT